MKIEKVAFDVNDCRCHEILITVEGHDEANYLRDVLGANNFYVWHTVNGSGIDPAPAGRLAIPVAVLSTDTNAQVALKTQFAMLFLI